MEASSERPDAARRVQPLLLALSLLTLVTGLVDAACYLGLGRVFTANMTGNVVLLAFGAAGAQGLPVLAPTVSLLVFLVGAAAGGRLVSSVVGPAGAEVPAPLRRRWVTVSLLGELGLVAVAAVVALGLPVGGGGARRYVVIGLLAAALGLQNPTVRRLAVPDVTTTVLTLTLTGLAADSWLAGGRSPRAGRRVVAVGLMAGGRWWARCCCGWTSRCRCWRRRCWSRWPRWGSSSAGKSVPFALALAAEEAEAEGVAVHPDGRSQVSRPPSGAWVANGIRRAGQQ